MKKEIMPRYFLIKENIKKEILEGKYDKLRKRLPGTRELAKIHDASYLTVNKALKVLEDEGYIKMVQGSGIFALPQKERNAKKASYSEKRNAALLMPSSGDIYQNMFSSIFRKLDDKNILPIHLADPSEVEKMRLSEREEKFDKFTSQGIHSLIVEGNRHFQFKLLKKFQERIEQLVFTIYFDSGIDFPGANFILSDFHKGGYIAAKHLIKNSWAKLGLLTFEKLPMEKIRQYGSSVRQYDSDVEDGIKAALAESSLDPSSDFSVLGRESADIEKGLTAFMKNGGNGLICLGDYRALPVYRLLAKMGIKIGKDFGIVGYYNTSWTNVFDPPLASISIDEEKIADIAAEAVIKNWSGKKMKVTPRLVIRDSV